MYKFSRQPTVCNIQQFEANIKPYATTSKIFQTIHYYKNVCEGQRYTAILCYRKPSYSETSRMTKKKYRRISCITSLSTHILNTSRASICYVVSLRLSSTSEECWDHVSRVGVPVTVLKVTGSKTVQGVSFNHEFLASAYSRLHGLCFLNNQSG